MLTSVLPVVKVLFGMDDLLALEWPAEELADDDKPLADVFL